MSEPFGWEQPYPSRRSPVLAANVVATSQPLAAQAGLAMLGAGGNAVDAALAAAVALTVVEPTSNGLGSDAFALVWDGRKLHGLNASGRAPAAWTRERFKHCEAMPMTGWDAVTVPGAVSAWAALSSRFGRLPFERLFEPAVRYARDGYPVSPVIAGGWAAQAPGLGERFPDFAAAFLPGGRPPRAGERFRLPEMARTLEEIAATKGESFYRGSLAGRIAAASRQAGGAMTADDLGAHAAEWVEPVSVEYRGWRLHEIPPNGQGIAALSALGILGELPLGEHPADSADSLHLQIEAMKLAFADAHRHVTEPGHMRVAPDEMLDAGYLAERARLIDPRRACEPEPGLLAHDDTVYLTAADESGMMVSFIQSNFHGFGSGIVVPGTGISMQNRAVGFSLDPKHPNCVAGGKRPYHTIIPGFVTREGRPVMSFGVMGGPMQPQGHLQMMVRLADYAQNPQAAADAPRWRVDGGLDVSVEPGFAPGVLEELRRRGHRLKTDRPPSAFGGAQLVWRLAGGGYCAGSDPRKDGHAVGF